MDRRGIIVLAVVLLAGCGGTAGSPEPSSPTVTPAPVPVETDVPTTTPNSMAAPGISPAGVVDAGRLVNSHSDVLATRSFTAYVNSTRRLPNGSLRSRYVRRIQFAADKDRFYYFLNQYNRANTGVRNRTIERWADGHRVLESTVQNGHRTSRVVRTAEPSRSFPENASNRVDLYRLLTSMDTSVVEVFQRNGTIEYHLIGGPQPVPPLRNVTLTAVVTDRGLIKEYRVAYTVGPEETRVVVTAKYLRLGRTDVTLPDWVTEMD